MFTDYADFEIDISPLNQGGFPITIRAPGGDAQGSLRPLADDPDYQLLARRMAAGSSDESMLEQIGQRLFGALFQGQIKDVYVRTQGMLAEGQALRFLLSIPPGQDQVAALPWELLNDPDRGPLALLDASVVRYVPQSARAPTLKADLPLKVLLTSAQPQALNLDRALADIQAALAGLGGYVEVVVEPHLTFPKLQRRLREQVEVWHFVGQSGIGGDGRTAQVLLEGEAGEARPSSAAELGILLSRSAVRLVVLDILGGGGAPQLLHSFAAALSRAQVPAVVAMQFGAAQESGRAFAEQFYRALAEGFPLDACVLEGRRAVMGVAGLGQADWSAPALYSRAAGGRLFDLPLATTPTIPGAVVALGSGAQGSAQVGVNLAAGALLYAAPPAAIRRSETNPAAPRPLRSFLDREELLRDLEPALKAGRATWLHGPRGCGLTALLRQAANTTAASAFADGVLYLNGDLEPSQLEDLIQILFDRFYTSDVSVHLTPAAARSYLDDVRALFLLDRPRLNGAQLAALADLLAGGAVLLAAEGAAPDTLDDLPLAGLPRQDALRLCAAAARLDGDRPELATLLDRLCAALDDLPLPIVLVGSLIRHQAAPPEQLLAVLAEMRDEPEALARAARLALIALSADEQAVLAALVRAGGADAPLDALAAISGRPVPAVEAALARQVDLCLVAGGGERYAVATVSLRRVLDRLLPAGEERRNAAAFFALAAQSHLGDLGWLAVESRNLIAAAHNALAAGQVAQVGPLAKALQASLVLRGQWGGWGQVIGWAEQAARAAGDRELLAWALHEQGTRAALLGHRAAASANLLEARRLRLDLGDRAAAAATQHNLAYLGMLPPPRPPAPPRPEPQPRPAPRSPIWLAALVVAVLLAIGAFAWRSGILLDPSVAIVPTAEPPAPTEILLPADTPAPPLIPTLTQTPTPPPTDTPTPPPTVTSTPVPANFGGAWETNFGRLVLAQDGTSVLSKYTNNLDQADESVSGTITGNILDGTWTRGDVLGTVQLLLSEDGQTFKTVDGSQNWCGARPGLAFPPGCAFAGEWRWKVSSADGAAAQEQTGSMSLTQIGTEISGTFRLDQQPERENIISGTLSFSGGRAVLSAQYQLGLTRLAAQRQQLTFVLDGYAGLQFQGNLGGRIAWCGWRAESKAPEPCFAASEGP